MGKRTSNHEIVLWPSLQIKFKIHVQNNTYISLNVNTNTVLDTLQL